MYVASISNNFVGTQHSCLGMVIAMQLGAGYIITLNTRGAHRYT